MICLLLFGCSHVPLGSMLKLSAFDENSFLSLNPHELRSRIEVDSPLKIDVHKTNLSLKLDSSSGDLLFDYPLKLLFVKDLPAEAHWLSPIPARTQYVLALSDEAIDNFTALQARMRVEQPKRYHLTIDTGFQNGAEEQSEAVLSVSIKLSAETDYITLLDRVSIDVKEEQL
jgi:hypothetical protein|uniref:Uncharacterized protein n=2 Tax=unclassified Marinomonas TaxID=196814 RepID=A6VSE3_MARMS